MQPTIVFPRLCCCCLQKAVFQGNYKSISCNHLLLFQSYVVVRLCCYFTKNAVFLTLYYDLLSCQSLAVFVRRKQLSYSPNSQPLCNYQVQPPLATTMLLSLSSERSGLHSLPSPVVISILSCNLLLKATF